jgi:diaminohydroxyphosphoribosylaminopyrimidine deaminase/5-amino-6-(5-phosphoribosylamino)uracil reductase
VSDERDERDERFMGRALELAAKGLGETNPNPVVGCVIAKGRRVVGEGLHRRAGGPHAEVEALARAGSRARGATLYVNLEPCAHQGRTPACAPLVRDSGVARVVAALRDPNPLVAGRGLALIRRAGVKVATGVLAPEASRLNERFLVAARSGRPFVLLKAAQTLDGRIATASGHSKWITSVAERRQARWLRRLHDAVLVGIETVLADDPLLLPSPRTRRPFVRVVLDSHLRLPAAGRLAGSARPATPVLVVATRAVPSRRRELEDAGVEVLEAASSVEGVSLEGALDVLRARGIMSVMVEGGSEVLGSFLGARLVDQVALFRAPLLLGGRGSRPAFGGPDPASIGDALRVRPVPDRPSFPWPWSPRFELWAPDRGSGRRRSAPRG